MARVNENLDALRQEAPGFTSASMTATVADLPWTVRLAEGEDDLRAAQRLRYRVFVEELGGDGPLVDHDAKLEIDDFDPVAEHLLLEDPARPESDRIVGVYRLMDRRAAEAAGGFYSAAEFDLGPLLAGERPVLELGRSCLHPDYRGGLGMRALWSALAELVRARGVEILFGTASFHGTDLAALADPLRLLHRDHLAPEDLRARAQGAGAVPPSVFGTGPVDRRAALRQGPALIKAYLRLGGVIGEGAFVDRQFNTTDVLTILDMGRVRPDAARRAVGTAP